MASSTICSYPILSIDDLKAALVAEQKPNGNISIRGVARLCGIHQKSLIVSDGFVSEKLGQKLMEQGFQADGLVENGFPPEAVWLTIEYFAYDSKAKAPGAKQLARTFGSIGIMTTIKNLTEPEKPQSTPEFLPRQLPPVRDNVDLANAAKLVEGLKNPIIKAALEQALAEDISFRNGKALEPAEDESTLVLAAVLARDLGYNLKPGEDAKLGRYVKQFHDPEGRTQHGKYEVNVYSRAKIIDTVHSFFR